VLLWLNFIESFKGSTDAIDPKRHTALKTAIISSRGIDIHGIA
jgi:hypothetical protein